MVDLSKKFDKVRKIGDDGGEGGKTAEEGDDDDDVVEIYQSPVKPKPITVIEIESDDEEEQAG